MAHYSIEFPRDIAQGCQAILERRDEVVMLASGHEESNQRWTHARRSWAAGLAIRSHADLAKVVELFEEVRGRANSFHFRDWLDWRSALAPGPITPTDQPLGSPITGSTEYEPAFGDGVTTAFQITKRYGLTNPYLRPIALPHSTSLRVAVDGTEIVSGWTLSPTGGVLTFDTPPAAGLPLTAGFTFDVPVRFSDSSLSLEWAYFNENGGSGMAPDITLIEKRLDWLS
ncbi:TIGR02217 family protein [Epibacterium sp. SM1979]|uniref:TIGR02217 family protein n=1 Tax=Tritonibacter litoralis TaxID=2662264 RepID=A0A843YDX0_9RHOB|nr:DUF2460 domain-containing protein [Tritonibacter litoralis]MQQ09111.1 TIGR02217 family protein [Tritonibacter litoralis]